MRKFIKKGKKVAGFAGILLAAALFPASSIAGDLSSLTDRPNQGETVFIRLASLDTDTDRPGASKEDLQQLEKEMKHVFAVLGSIIKDKSLTEEQKKQKAIEFLRNYRYGPEKESYFWINDLQGIMLMHPIIPDLEGNSVANVRDQDGAQIFTEFNKIAMNKGEGFFDYVWPPPEGEKPEPMTALVKLLKGWGWVIGTGVYLETLEAYEEPLPAGTMPFDDTTPVSQV